MLKYVLKRVVAAVLTILVLITIVFFLVRLMPGEPFTSAKLTPEVAENMRSYYGFDKPMIVQYLQYMGNLLQGDFGYSMKYTNRTVNDIIGETFPFSADLGIRALVMAVSIGLILGIVSARNRGKKIDFFCVIVAVLGTSIPDFIMGAVLQYTFGIKWGLFPVARYEGIEYTILPACALAFYTLASVTFVIESIFAIPGMGKYYVESVSNNDYSMVLGMTVFYGIFLVTCNLVVDVLYGVADPRVRIGKR